MIPWSRKCEYPIYYNIQCMLQFNSFASSLNLVELKISKIML